MTKNAVQSLSRDGKTYVEKQVSNMFPKSGTFNQSTQPISEEFKPATNPTQPGLKAAESQGGIDLWTWVYLAINIFILYLGYRSDEVLGVTFFSIVILLLVLWRRKRPKPYNWVVKIILVLQSVLLFAFIAEQIEYFGIITLLMVLLFFVNLRLIFKGNKHQ